jgi:hypothetical protein
LDPKSKGRNYRRKDPTKVLSHDPDLSRAHGKTDKSMEISAEHKADLVSDPNYPSYEILLNVAGKLLESFEKQ